MRVRDFERTMNRGPNRRGYWINKSKNETWCAILCRNWYMFQIKENQIVFYDIVGAKTSFADNKMFLVNSLWNYLPRMKTLKLIRTGGQISTSGVGRFPKFDDCPWLTPMFIWHFKVYCCCCGFFRNQHEASLLFLDYDFLL